MATTSIWSIKNNLKQSINYIINPEKTTNEDYGKVDYDFLEGKKDYNFRKEKVCYVSTLNCDENYPYDDMIDTKDYFNKKDGVLAYHGYQSFKEGEVTPDIAHEIGVKFAEEMFKDYEVVVATHQNTNHIHNHFIINSVSFKDGKKYNNNRTNLAMLRHISDSICAEYGLSVLDENIGYKVYSRNGIITIYRDGEDKVRIEKAFGEEYSKDRLSERLYSSRQIVFKPMSQKSIFEEYCKSNKPHKGIYGLYLYYCYLLGVFPKKHPKQYLPYSIRKEVYKLEQISQQVRFMHEKNIVTKEDLDNFANNNSDELSKLKGIRENLWKKYHRARAEEKRTQILAEINDIQPKIKELYKYDKYCKEITKRAEGIQNNLNNFDKDIQKEKDNSRSS